MEFLRPWQVSVHSDSCAEPRQTGQSLKTVSQKQLSVEEQLCTKTIHPAVESPADSWCFTSTEARWPIIGTGTEWEGDDRVVKARPRKPPELKDRSRRPWTAARTMEVLRRCPLAVSTAVLGQSHKDNVRCTAVDQQLGQLAAKAVQLS